MNLLQIKNIFTAILPDETHHNEACTKAKKYIVWAEEGQVGASHADNKLQEQIIEGTIDLFTNVEYDPLFDDIQKAMNNAELSWRLESTQYERETRFYHHEWIWRTVNTVG